MNSWQFRVLVTCVIFVTAALAACASDCPYSLVKTMRVTSALGKSRTGRDNARCICRDVTGKLHMVWEDTRSGNFEIYYALATSDSVLGEVRITSSRGESTHPCVACDSEDVYILWQERAGRTFDVYYAHLRAGQVIARRAITRTHLDSSCPVAAVGPDGALHIAWHEGPYKQTAIYYGKIVGDSMITKQPICTTHPEAFRPDIACDDEGRLLIVWFEGPEVKSRFWDGTAWGQEQLVATNRSRSWRLSVAWIGNGKWGSAWFDNSEKGSDVFAKFFDGDKWYGQVRLDDAEIAYYPSITGLRPGEIAAVWEEQAPDKSAYRLVLRCCDGRDWSEPLEIYLESVAGRYASMTYHDDELHTVWFSAKPGNDEIYYGLLRRK